MKENATHATRLRQFLRTASVRCLRCVSRETGPYRTRSEGVTTETNDGWRPFWASLTFIKRIHVLSVFTVKETRIWIRKLEANSLFALVSLN